ncbi:hypothetical protein BKA65DRAFT_268044 [Rhexocercosporidium sp. MPI-PUGE-AT-0058]|nr:hypothetical protein BKA65DRAFT_268044 [Rhexocercosporidium sp. MPI-PUGE-AT-0058]
MQLPPASVIISWPAPNYKDPVTTGPSNVVITCIFYPLVCVIIWIRCYTRLRISRSFGLDDWLILASMVPTTAVAILALLAEWKFNWNRHIWDVKPDTIVAGLKVILSTQILFSAATTLTKVSMLALIYRIVAPGSKKYSKVIIGAMILIAAEGVAFFFTVMFQCGKPSTYWTLSFEPQPRCISETSNLLAAGILNTVCDLIVIILPIPIIWRLKLPIQQQIIVILLFGAGVLITVASVIRTYYLYKVTSTWDKTWNAVPAFIASSVELYVGIMCASIPATKKFFSRFNSRLFGASTSLHKSSNARHRHAYLANSTLGTHNVELGTFSGYGYLERKEDTSIEAGSEPPQYLNAAGLSPHSSSISDTSKSVQSVGWGGVDDVTRVDSEDELVDRNCHSPPQD